MKTLLITLSALALSATANAALLNDGAYDGTYSGPNPNYGWDPLFNFTFESGKVYGISANMSVSAITWTANDQGANGTFLTVGNTNTGEEYAFQNGTVGIGQNIYTYGGGVNLFAQPLTAGFSTVYTGGGNLDKGTAPQSLNVGFSLDTTGTTWSVKYYQGGTGFNDTAVYQGGTLLGTSTGIAAGTFKGIFLYYTPWSATGTEAQSVVSNFRVVDSVPETYATWASTKAGGQTANLDWDNDGVTNGVEYFMNSEAGFTANPALVGGTVTWPNGGKIPSDAYGSQFEVQKSTDLANWSAVASDDINLSNTAGALTWKVASIANGNMGSFTGDLPSSWGVSGGTLTSDPSADNSPFTNKLADNGSSWIIDDSTDTTGAAGFLQAFSNKTNYQSITVNFDFMVPTLTANQAVGAWGIQFDGDGVASRPQAASSSVHYRIDRNGNFSINNSAGITDIVALEANSWYNVQATFQVTANNTSGTNGAGYQSGKITKWGGASTSWNNVALINTTQGFSRLLVRDRSASSTGSLLLDNVSVAPQDKEFVRLKVTPN